MDPALLVALLAFAGTIVSPLILSRIRSREKREDWARQDQVAKNALQAAMELARKTAATTAAQEAAAKVTSEKLDIIHVLVNSNMTAAMEGELAALQTVHALLTTNLGKDPNDPATQAAIATNDARMAELEAQLRDRRTSQASIDAAAALTK